MQSKVFQSGNIQQAIDYLSGRLRLGDIVGNDRVEVQRFLNMREDDIISTNLGENIPFGDLVETLGSDYPTVMRSRLQFDVDTLDLDYHEQDTFQGLLDEFDEDMDALAERTGGTTDALQDYIDGEIAKIQENLQGGDTQQALDRMDFLAEDVDARNFEAQPAVEMQELPAAGNVVPEKFDTRLATRTEQENLMHFAEQAYGGRELTAFEEELLWTKLQQRRLQKTIWGDADIDLSNQKPEYMNDWMENLNLKDPVYATDIARIERRLNTRLADFTAEQAGEIKTWLNKEQYVINQRRLSAMGSDMEYAADVTIDRFIGDNQSEYSNLDERVNPDPPPEQIPGDAGQEEKWHEAGPEPIQEPAGPTGELEAPPPEMEGTGAVLEVNGQQVAIPEAQAPSLNELLQRYTAEELAPCISQEGDLIRFNPANLPDAGSSFMQSEFWSGMGEVGGTVLAGLIGLGVTTGFKAVTGLDDMDTGLLFSTMNLMGEATAFTTGATLLSNAWAVYQKYNHKNYIRQMNTHAEEHPLANRLALVRRNGKIYPALTRYVRRGDNADSQIMITYGTDPHMVRDATGHVTWKFDTVLGNLDQSYFPDGFTLEDSGFTAGMGMQSLVENPLMPFCILNDQEVGAYMDNLDGWNNYISGIASGDPTATPPAKHSNELWGTQYDETDLNDAINRYFSATYDVQRWVGGTAGAEETASGGYSAQTFYETDQKIASAMDLYTDLLETMSQHDPTLYNMQSYGQGFREEYYQDFDDHMDMYGDDMGVGRNVDALQNMYHTQFEVGYGERAGMLERYKYMVGGTNDQDVGMLNRMDANLNSAYQMLGDTDLANIPLLGGGIPQNYNDLDTLVNQVYNLDKSWEVRNFLSQKLMYRYTLNQLAQSPYKEVRHQTQEHIMNTIQNTADGTHFSPPIWYEAGEGRSVLPDWAWSTLDAQDSWYVTHGIVAPEDAQNMLADDHDQGYTHENMSRERFNQIYGLWDFDNNWLVQRNADPNIIDLGNVEITNRIHAGIDTTGGSPTPPAPIPGPEPIQPPQPPTPAPTPVPPAEHHEWLPQHVRPIQKPAVTVQEVGEYDAIKFTATQQTVAQRNVPRARSQQEFHHQYQQLKTI